MWYRNFRCVILGSEDLKIEQNYNASDRRKINMPVENDRRTGIDRRARARENTEKELLMAFEALPPVRRLASLPDKLDNGDVLPALGAASLALINLPEDLRDIKAASEQIKSFVKGEKYVPKYDYREYQHPFSFFRGTMLHDLANPNVAKHPEIAEKLFAVDKTLVDTKFGKNILNLLKTENSGIIETKIKAICHTAETPLLVTANKYKGSAFGQLTARAMTRTTTIGLAALALIEAPKIIKAAANGDNIVEKIDNAAEQTLKSGVNVALTAAGIGYGGAIGFKKFGATGSIVGMGFGAILGSCISKKTQNTI